MMKRTMQMLMVTVAMVAAICMAVFGSGPGPEQAKTAEPSKKTESAPGIELSSQSAEFVEIARVGVQTNQIWGRRVPARVSLQTSAHVNVGAIVDGRVEQVLVRPGDFVQTGAPLLKIHSVGGGQARAEALQAINRLEAAEDNLRRF